MPQIRKNIRDAVVSALRADAAILARLGGETLRVEAGRVLPLEESQFPRVLVDLAGETAERELLLVSPRTYRLEAELVVEFVHGASPATSNLEDQADEAALELDSVLAALEMTRFGGLVRQARYVGTDVVGDVSGHVRTFSSRLRYSLEYGRQVGAATPNDFATNAIEYAADVAPADNPSDSISLPNS